MYQILISVYFLSFVNGYVIFDPNLSEDLRGLLAVNGGKFPEIWDWRERKMVSPVKDQQSCGACWAFTVKIKS